MKRASTFAGWLIFVLLPPILLGWALDTGFSLSQESEIRRTRDTLSQFSRDILADTATLPFIQEVFSLERLPQWKEPAFAAEAGLPGSNSIPLLEEVRIHLENGTHPAQDRYDIWRNQLGWEFDLHRFRRRPGVPTPVRWGRNEAWLIWASSPPKSVSTKTSLRPRLALFLPPPLSERIMAGLPRRAMEQGINWALVNPIDGNWKGSRQFDRRFLRPILSSLAQRTVSLRRTISHHLLAEKLDEKLVLIFQKQFPGWFFHTSSRLIWLFAFGLLLLLSLMFPRLASVVPAWPLKFKFFGIFAYLVGLPLAGVAIFSMGVTADRVHLKQTELLRLARSELLRFDDGIRDEIRSTQAFFQSIPEDPDLKKGHLKPFLKKAREWVKTGRITRLEIRDWQNHPYILVSSIRDDPGFEKFNGMIAQDVLQKSGSGRQMDEKALDPLTMAYQAIVDHPEFGMTEVARKPNTLVPFVLGKNWFFWFWSIGRDPNRPEAFFDFTRSHHQLAGSYVRSNILRNRPVRLFVRDRRNNRWFPRPPSFSGLQNLCEGVVRTGVEQVGRFRGGSQSWLALGIPGTRLENFDLIALVSEREILSESVNLRQFVGWGVGFALLIGGFCALLLSESLLTPLGDLAGGIAAIKQRKADHRVPVRSRDEMGRMALAFNRMIENIGDLDMAKVVQESLLPDSFPVPTEYEVAVWGRMTASVGGDYCDCISVNETSSAFMIGDVSGHGVSAALVMAMAKARVFSHFDEGGKDTGLLEQLNNLLYHLTSRRQLMTFCLALIDFSTHRGTMTVAGNPLPVIFHREDGSVDHLGNIAYPLAVKENQLFQPVPFNLERGDLVLLYTDGVVEAIDSANRPYGYERLHDLVRRTGDGGAKACVQRLQEDLSSHLGDRLPLDDVTVLVLSRKLISVDSTIESGDKSLPESEKASS